MADTPPPTELVAPPAPTEPPQARVDFRVYQILLSILTLAFTVWMWMIHPIVGIATTFIAKHVLVAILASGLSYPPGKEPFGPR